MYWNKQTRNAAGDYYPPQGPYKAVEKRLENFTQVEPPPEAFEGMPVDWVDDKWVYDLDSFNSKRFLANEDSLGEMNRTVEEILDALKDKAPEVYAIISDYGKAKVAQRKAMRAKI